MSWNPDNKDKDPWGNRPGNQGPPDLDEVVKKMQEGLGKIFGGGGGQKKVQMNRKDLFLQLQALYSFCYWDTRWFIE